jgi:hypothetical protein
VLFVPNIAEEISKAAPGVIYGAILIGFLFLLPDGFAGLLRRTAAAGAAGDHGETHAHARHHDPTLALAALADVPWPPQHSAGQEAPPGVTTIESASAAPPTR